MYDTNKKLSIWTRFFNQSTEIDLRLKKSYEKFLYMAVKHPFKYRNGFILATYAVNIFLVTKP
jgi:hypothetical protein